MIHNMIEGITSGISILIIIFCFVAFFIYDPYFDQWEECRVKSSDFINNKYHHPYINEQCCQYELIGNELQCNSEI